MTFWIVVGIGIFVAGLSGAVWWKVGRAGRRRQDPQNIYPLW